MQRVEFEITQLQKGVSQGSAGVLQLKEEVVSIGIELTRLSTLQADCATKADMKALEANSKGWMLGVALTILSLNFGMNLISNNARKATAAVKSAHALQAIPPQEAATLILK